jgi:hypothetical protein
MPRDWRFVLQLPVSTTLLIVALIFDIMMLPFILIHNHLLRRPRTVEYVI